MLPDSRLDGWFDDGIMRLQPYGEGRMVSVEERQPVEERRLGAPGHLWVVGVISLLWNSFGCLDYIRTVTRDPVAMAQLTPDTLAYLDAMPAWLTGFWALGVWGSLAGSLLLIARSRHAVPAFGLSLLGLAISQGYQMMTEPPPEMSGTAMVIFTGLIWGMLLLLLWYASAMKRTGVLR